MQAKDEEARTKACDNFTKTICEENTPAKTEENKEILPLIELCKKQESIRKISRNYEPLKEDIRRVEAGKEPHKPFVSDNDFNYWKGVIHNTDKCIGKGGEKMVRNHILSLIC